MHLVKNGIPKARAVSSRFQSKMPNLHEFPCSDFKPSAVMFAPHHYGQIILSDVGVIIWAACVGTAIYKFGFADVFRLYLAPYIWCASSLLSTSE